jgi:hypothetical protein
MSKIIDMTEATANPIPVHIAIFGIVIVDFLMNL